MEPWSVAQERVLGSSEDQIYWPGVWTGPKFELSEQLNTAISWVLDPQIKKIFSPESPPEFQPGARSQTLEPILPAGPSKALVKVTKVCSNGGAGFVLLQRHGLQVQKFEWLGPPRGSDSDKMI